jgi:NADPH:quinone reductase-like Zn-dependent oxidoreductase
VRAVVHDRYGPPAVLRLAELQRLLPEDDEVLVNVHATTVTRTDCGMRGAPTYTKEDVLFLKGLIEAGQYRAVGDRTYPLEDVVEETKYVETQQKTGNVVLIVASDRAPTPLTP